MFVLVDRQEQVMFHYYKVIDRWGTIPASNQSEWSVEQHFYPCTKLAFLLVTGKDIRRSFEKDIVPPQDIWTKKDGTKIEIGDMTTAHIKNAIRFLKDKWISERIAILDEWSCKHTENAEWWLTILQKSIEERYREYRVLNQELARRAVLGAL